MQCPDCGYEVDASAVFCPQCRFQFRDSADETAAASDTVMDVRERGVISDDSIFEETSSGFPDKELMQLEVQLLAPAVLVVLIISLFTYTVIPAIPFTPVTVAGLKFEVPGIVCLTCGLVAGMVFFIIVRRSFRKFRYQ